MGILDVMLVSVALFATISTVIRPRVVAATPHRQSDEPWSWRAAVRHPVGFYGLWSAIAITVTLLINVQSGISRIDDLNRAAMPFFATSFVVICFMTVALDRSKAALQAGFAIGSFVVGLIYVAGYLTGVETMFFEIRFAGFSLNPNQTAMQALATLLILATTIIQTRSKIIFYLCVASIPLTAIYGAATLSDAFVICFFPAMAVLLLIIAARYRIRLGIAILVGAFLALAFFLSLIAALPGFFGNLGAMVSGQLTQGGQDSVRTLLWQHGVMAWQHRPWFGNGPGGWSGIGAPFQGLEAHNSIIDWLTITGLFGVLPIFFILRRPFIISDNFKLLRVVGIFALTIFTLFHFVFRLPIFWFAVAMLLIPFENTIANNKLNKIGKIS